MWYQLGQEQVEWSWANSHHTARQTLDAVKEMFLDEDFADWFVGVSEPGVGGHAVVPYRLTRVGEGGRYRLYVYDNNCPGGPCDTTDPSSLPWIDFDSTLSIPLMYRK